MFLHFGILLLLSQGLLGEVDVSEAIDGDSRIIGGQDATPGTANYQVSIRSHIGNKDWHSCGGSILNEEYVLTAAHCIYQENMKEMSIIVGTHMINKGGDRYKIKKLIPHEKYSRQTLKNDIGIVQIQGKFKYSDKVQPIELLNEMVPIGKKCLLTGWGLINYTKQTSPNNLQMLEYETISNDACSKRIKSSLYAGQLCAKRPNHKGACSGDSGGPLVIQDDKNKTVQIGVASGVVNPCASNYPDLFDSVHSFYDWIQSNIK
ncbi:chymotrypsin-2-like [Pieris napi]|uniref:chymotrypsin-2-like n=1 Tax=Pieris napi TaxID=78633 RepID=UPI001FBA5B42|nr:chymotrypsin-2-like [Pieris napi]